MQKNTRKLQGIGLPLKFAASENEFGRIFTRTSASDFYNFAAD